MKKSKDFIRLLEKVMKISVLQFIIAIVFSSLSLGHTGYAQKMLEKKITFQARNQKMEAVLNTISQLSGVNFMYSPELIQAERNISITVQNRQLHTVLEELLDPLDISFEVYERKILLKKRERLPDNKSQARIEYIENAVPDADAEISIRGRVTDENGEALPGVSILIRGTRQGTITSTSGAYTISVPDQNAVLVFSYVGFVTQEIEVGSRRVLDVKLSVDVKVLEETVVVGYGSVRKSDLTGSVGTVNISEMVKAPVSSFADALAGRVAGLQVASADGQPGRSPNIVIRGVSSLTQRVSPLFVVDGFPIDNLNPSTIDPDDIESISVLKDASSTAIYGSRAGNGVILIQTKRGKEGKPTINFSNSTGYQIDNKRMEVMSPYEFVRYISELHPSAVYVQRYFDDDRTLDYYKTAQGIDWQDEVFRTGSFQKNNLSIRGGTRQTKYSFSGSVFNQNGVIKNTGMKRQTANFTLDQEVNSRLKAGISFNYSGLNSFGQIISASSSSSVSSYLMFRTWGYRPVTAPFEDLNDLLVSGVDQTAANNSDFRVNPRVDLENQHFFEKTNAFQGNSYVSLELLDGLTLKVTGGVRGTFFRQDQFYNTNTVQANPSNIYNLNGVYGSIRHNLSQSWSNENTLTYKKTFNDNHTITALGIFSMYKNIVMADGYGGRLLPNEQLKMDGLDQGLAYDPVASTSQNSLLSYASRIDYGFKSKYLFTVNFRADGSSKFKNPWGYFPGAAIAWNMHRESFLEGLRPVVSSSKLRTSYGVNGNNWVGDFSRFPTLSQNVNGYSFDNQSPGPAAYISNIGNAGLRWEKVSTFDIGYELGLFNERIQLEADLYRRKTNDLLLNAPLPLSTGFSSAFQNIGSMLNRGLEISLRTVNIESNTFTWSSSFNISFNQNKILSLAQDQQKILSNVSFEPNFRSPLYVSEIGRPAGMIIGYVWDGNYQYDDFDNPAPGIYMLKPGVPTNGSLRSEIQPGDIKYKDLNGDGVVNGFDRTVIGRGQPIHVGGFSNNLSYRGFTLNAFLQWSYGNDLYNANRLSFEGNSEGRYNMNQFASYADRWTPENPTNKNFRAGGKGPEGMHSSKVVEDGSFLRLKTLSLSYKLPEHTVQALKVKKLEVSISAQNLITLTRYTGLDPEVSTRGSVLTPGFDFSAYPQVPTVVMGINIDL